jgi:hypothetical protein
MVLKFKYFKCSRWSGTFAASNLRDVLRTHNRISRLGGNYLKPNVTPFRVQEFQIAGPRYRNDCARVDIHQSISPSVQSSLFGHLMDLLLSFSMRCLHAWSSKFLSHGLLRPRLPSCLFAPNFLLVVLHDSIKTWSDFASEMRLFLRLGPVRSFWRL